MKEGQQYASLTDIITKEWSGKTTAQYKRYKGLHKESLRDNMTNMELALNIFAEASTAEISKARNPKGYRQSAEIAHKGGQIAGEARKKLEEQIGHSIPSSLQSVLPTISLHPTVSSYLKTIQKRMTISAKSILLPLHAAMLLQSTRKAGQGECIRHNP